MVNTRPQHAAGHSTKTGNRETASQVLPNVYDRFIDEIFCKGCLSSDGKDNKDFGVASLCSILAKKQSAFHIKLAIANAKLFLDLSYILYLKILQTTGIVVGNKIDS